MENRRKTRAVRVRNVWIGGGHPVSIQTMTKTPTKDVRATLRQIKRVEKLGCHIVRLAVPDRASVDAFRQIRKKTQMPLVADVHFDHRLAIGAIEAGADKIRINPGNIPRLDELKRIADAAIRAGVPVRVGVNSGSVQRFLSEDSRDMAGRMAEVALEYAQKMERCGIKDIVISAKASGVETTIHAYEEIARSSDYPLHLGVTAAGPATTGLVRSALGIGSLLLEGIGDTIRVSLTAPPEEEVKAAREILRTTGADSRGIQIVSCPTCGRCKVDLSEVVRKVTRTVESSGFNMLCRPLSVAIMGCEVNGPGEAKEADLGIAAGRGRGMLFKKGRKVRRVEERDFTKVIIGEINEMVKSAHTDA